MNNVQIADLISKECKQKDIKISELLQDCNINHSFISDIRHKNRAPSVDKISAIADYLDVSVDYLLGRTENPTIQSGSCYVSDNKNGIVQANNGSAVVNANLSEQKSADIISQFLQAFDKLKIEDKVEVMYFALQKAKE